MGGQAIGKILPVVGTVIGGIYGGPQGAGVGASLGAALGGVTKEMTAPVPDKPTITPPVNMPSPDEIEKARRRTLEDQFSRRGRASTILAAPLPGSDKLSGL